MSASTIANDLLTKLLHAGNKHAAGARARSPALTATHLKPYSDLRSWQQKQECDETFLAAQDVGAVTLQRDKLNPKDGLIERIDLVDVQALARFLGHSTYADQLAQTIGQLEQHGQSAETGPSRFGYLDRCSQNHPGLCSAQPRGDCCPDA